MATFQEAKGHNGGNIRKILEMAIFAKPVDEADTEITQVWTTAGGLTVPAGYLPIGHVTKGDGAKWTKDQESSEVMSFGYGEPTRTDRTKDATGLDFTMQESKRNVMEMYHGIDLSSVTTDADGNFHWSKAARPADRYYRVLALGKDGDGPDAVYLARWLPRAKVTESGEQAWSEEDEINYPASLMGYVDQKFGTSFREIWGGPGLDHAAMGFPAPA